MLHLASATPDHTLDIWATVDQPLGYDETEPVDLFEDHDRQWYPHDDWIHMSR